MWDTTPSGLTFFCTSWSNATVRSVFGTGAGDGTRRDPVVDVPPLGPTPVPPAFNPSPITSANTMFTPGLGAVGFINAAANLDIARGETEVRCRGGGRANVGRIAETRTDEGGAAPRHAVNCR